MLSSACSADLSSGHHRPRKWPSPRASKHPCCSHGLGSKGIYLTSAVAPAHMALFISLRYFASFLSHEATGDTRKGPPVPLNTTDQTNTAFSKKQGTWVSPEPEGN